MPDDRLSDEGRVGDGERRERRDQRPRARRRRAQAQHDLAQRPAAPAPCRRAGRAGRPAAARPRAPNRSATGVSSRPPARQAVPPQTTAASSQFVEGAVDAVRARPGTGTPPSPTYEARNSHSPGAGKWVDRGVAAGVEHRGAAGPQAHAGGQGEQRDPAEPVARPRPATAVPAAGRRRWSCTRSGSTGVRSAVVGLTSEATTPTAITDQLASVQRAVDRGEAPCRAPSLPPS